MFPIIFKIESFSLPVYAVFFTVIAGTGIAVLFVSALMGRLKREVVTTVLFWVTLLAVIGLVPFLTPVTIYSYGLMFAVAVVICTALLVRDAKKKNIKGDIIFDLVFWMLVGGILGARLFYIGMHYEYFLAHPDEVIMLQNGGLAWQGGLIVGAFAGMSLVKRRKLFLPEILDLVGPYMALGQSIGRIGCFLNGCCYGKEWEGGIYFPVHDAVLHPTQLYLSGGYFVIFLILRQYWKSSSIPGLVFASYLILAAGLRFVVEFFRADQEIFFFGFSIFQFVCAGVLLFAFGFAYLMLIKYSNPEDSL